MFADSTDIQSGRQAFDRGALVACSGLLHGVQSPDGDVVPCDRLGPGLIEESTGDGVLRVWWSAAGFSSVLDSTDCLPLGRDARLVVVHHFDKSGQIKLSRQRILGGVGFRDNWTIELRPPNVVRVIRWDGQAWTFRKNPIFSRLTTTAWVTPPEDDDAEALAAAELALFR